MGARWLESSGFAIQIVEFEFKLVHKTFKGSKLIFYQIPNLLRGSVSAGLMAFMEHQFLPWGSRTYHFLRKLIF